MTMNNETIAKALTNLVPDAEWTLSGDDYSNLNWLSEGVPPTVEQIEAEIATPTPRPQPTVAEKLAEVGLSIDNLKAALGV